MNTESQNEMIKEALLNGQRLTALDILYQFQSLRASARIYDLRNQGMNIRTDFINTRTGKRIAQYSLVKPRKKVS